MDLDSYSYFDFESLPHGVLLITINRDPEHMNPANEELHRDLARVWLEFDADPNYRVAVITGAGRGFCAGGDIEMERRMAGNLPAVQQELKVARDIVMNMVNCEKPIISAINGPAVGAGLAVALMADISIISETTRFTDGHVKLGVAAGDHAAIIWPLLCGMARAKYYLLTSDRIEAREAERIGLVSKCVAPGDLLPESLAVAERLAVGPQMAIRWTKRALNHWIRNAQPIFESSLAHEMLNFFGEDVVEGINAFAEKRDPHFPNVGL